MQEHSTISMVPQFIVKYLLIWPRCHNVLLWLHCKRADWKYDIIHMVYYDIIHMGFFVKSKKKKNMKLNVYIKKKSIDRTKVVPE